MPVGRKTRKQMVGKAAENNELALRVSELAEIRRLVRADWWHRHRGQLRAGEARRALI
ncbi:hypothetical protein GCM10023148_04510 [Actinokineospora soli]